MDSASLYPKDLEEAEPITVRQPALYTNIQYEVSAFDSRFFAELRDHGKILGVRCPTCNRVYVPPRINCKECFSELKEWVEVSNEGTLQTYTIVNQPGVRQPAEPPYALGIVRLDGADTGLVHCLGGADPAQFQIGMRVRAVFEDERTGNIKDIKYFAPVD